MPRSPVDDARRIRRLVDERRVGAAGRRRRGRRTRPATSAPVIWDGDRLVLDTARAQRALAGRSSRGAPGARRVDRPPRPIVSPDLVRVEGRARPRRARPGTTPPVQFTGDASQVHTDPALAPRRRSRRCRGARAAADRRLGGRRRPGRLHREAAPRDVGTEFADRARSRRRPKLEPARATDADWPTSSTNCADGSAAGPPSSRTAGHALAGSPGRRRLGGPDS